MTTEDVYPDDGEKDKHSAGGVILRAKRRQDSTAIDRARAYAFERIPPSAHTGPNGTGRVERATDGVERSAERPTRSGPYSSDKGMLDPCGAAMGADGDGNSRAPAHGEFGGNKGRDKPGLRLTRSSAEETPASTSAQAVAPWCKIDLRGCHKRPPLPLPLAPVHDISGLERPSVPVTRVLAGAVRLRSGKRYLNTCSRDRHQGGGRKVGANQNAGTAPGRHHTAVSRELLGDLARKIGSNASPAVVARAAPSRRRRRNARSGKPISRSVDVDGMYFPESEVADMEELTSLLSVSQRIFSRARRLHDSESPSRKERCAPAGGAFKENRAMVAMRRGLETRGAPSAARVRKEKPGSGSGSNISENGGQPAASSTGSLAASCRAKEVEGPGAVGGDNGAADGNERSGRGCATRAVSIAEVHSALGEQALEEICPPARNPSEEPDFAVKNSPCVGGEVAATDFAVGANTDWRESECPPQTRRESGDGPPRTDVGSEVLLLAEEGEAAVVDAAGVADYHDGSGWVYDEATESWYAATDGQELTKVGEAWADESGGGLYYDQQGATWYQHGPEEGSPGGVQALEQAAVEPSGNYYANVEQGGHGAWATADDHVVTKDEGCRQQLRSIRPAAGDEDEKVIQRVCYVMLPNSVWNHAKQAQGLRNLSCEWTWHLAKRVTKLCR